MYSKFFSDFFRVKLARKKVFENENLGDKIVENQAEKFEVYEEQKEQLPPLEISEERKKYFIGESEGSHNFF